MKKLIFLIIISAFLISSCSIPKFAKPGKVDRSTPINAKDRARKNIEEGRGISLKGAFSKGSTRYEFSTSNPLWRASLEIIDFMPLTTVDYSGGIIITDWFTDGNADNESIKITIRFLSNEIQSNSIKIIVHKKDCKINSNCAVQEIDSRIKFELSQSILKKAASLQAISKEQKKKK